MGKGSNQRPTNKAVFDKNWDKIFGNKSESSDKEKQDGEKTSKEQRCGVPNRDT